MTSAWLSLSTALLGVMSGALLAYIFGLKRDKEERRRERMIAHLIEAYRNIEIASCRDDLTSEEKRRFETSLAAVFLFGSKIAATKAAEFLETRDASNLLKQLRNELRQELGLEEHNVALKFFRFDTKVEEAK